MKQLFLIQDLDFEDELDLSVNNHELGANLSKVGREDNAFFGFDSFDNSVKFSRAEAGRDSPVKTHIGVNKLMCLQRLCSILFSPISK
jgi:hypothetical protein